MTTPNGNSGVATPGQIKVSPGSSTTYTLIAYCNNTSNQQSVTVNVNNPQPTPTPTPFPGNNEVKSITVKETAAKTWQLTIQYFWNGSEPPGRMNAAGTNSSGQQATNTGAADLRPGQTRTVNITIKGVNRGKPTQFWACIVGKSNVELACKTVNFP